MNETLLAADIKIFRASRAHIRRLLDHFQACAPWEPTKSRMCISWLDSCLLLSKALTAAIAATTWRWHCDNYLLTKQALYSQSAWYCYSCFFKALYDVMLTSSACWELQDLKWYLPQIMVVKTEACQDDQFISKHVIGSGNVRSVSNILCRHVPQIIQLRQSLSSK